MMIRELLESFVNEEFVRDLDFSSLTWLEKSFITDQFEEREADLICSVGFQDSPLYIYLLIEFQSTVDRFMSLRFLRYICEFYQYLVEKQHLREQLPAVFPVLLYNGDAKWTAATNIAELIAPSLPQCFIPSFEYCKVIENEFSEEILLQTRNTVSAVFLVENSDISILSQEFEKLVELLKNEDIEVVKLFTFWINNYLGNVARGEEIIGSLQSIEEVKTMLATSLERHDRKIAEQAGIEKGIEQGIEKGIEQGLEQSILRLSRKEIPSEEIARLLDVSVEMVKRVLS